MIRRCADGTQLGFFELPGLDERVLGCGVVPAGLEQLELPGERRCGAKEGKGW